MGRQEAQRATPKGVEYDGPSGIARESTWLTNEDLVEGKDANVQIEAVLKFGNLEFEGGRAKKNALGLKFNGKERLLLLNATNRKVMNAMFGSLTKAWKGQVITLFVTETNAFGEMVKCVRIRKQGARSATLAEQFLHDDEGIATEPSGLGVTEASEDDGDGETREAAQP